MYGGSLPAPATSVPANMVISDAIASQAAVMFNHDAGNANSVSMPSVSAHAPTPDISHRQRIGSNIPSPKDIVDEREVLAIEQSLKWKLNTHMPLL